MPDRYRGTPSADSYYERLGVDPDANEETIKRAGKLAKRTLHPDNNSSEQATAEREFDRVTDAADALTDSESRAAYDTFIDDQGPATGTDRYEEWEAAGRPKSPTAWLSEPRSSGSSSTASTSTTNASTTNGTSTTSRSTNASTTNNTSSRTRTDASRQPNADRRPNDRRRPSEQTTASTSADETAETATNDSYTAAASTPETETGERAEAASTTPTGRATSKRAPESVLGEDPEELYSKYVLDSDAAWGPGETEAGQTGGGSGTAGVTPSVAGAVVSRFVSAEVAADIDRVAAAPKPWWLRGGLAVVLLALAVVVGPVAERLALLPFVAVPRIGLWLYPTLAAGVTLAPELVPLETPGLWLAAYAGLSVGYVLLGRRLRMAGQS
ncbi:J domain-containing protein [Halonotius roseus]|uniref:J domain-containing protein n=1 Tax=Halonotius roseus TaxID=2511997 RepID=A0A544QNG6_9EURY|nr:J domain-containing protein [Halonotius roseus]TQQ80456.1 J domain-containing protein [Halonotius roseus]